MHTLEKTVTCQLFFLPIASESYRKDVKKVLEMIVKSGLFFKVGDVSTTVKGEKQKIMDLVSGIFDEMDPKCRFVLDLKLSNICGCD